MLKLDTFTGMHGDCFAFSPDGQRLAFCVQRSLQSATRHTDVFLAGVARSELWWIDLASGQIEEVTAEGDRFAPCWSPDGSMLAFGVATSESVRLSILNVRDGRRLTLTGNLTLRGKRPFDWIDDTQVVCAMVPGGELPRLFDLDRRACRKAPQTWAQLDRLGSSTVSVLDSGTGEPVASGGGEEPCHYLVFDVRSGEAVAGLGPDQQQALSSFQQRFDDPTFHEAGNLQAEEPPELPQGEPVACHRASDRWLFLVEDAAGSGLVLVDRAGERTVELFRTNRHLAEIEAGVVRDVQFTDDEGSAKTVRLLLPPGSRHDTTYPAVVWVYPGARVGPKCRHLLKPHESGQFCLHLLAAHGYIVIEPDLSIPSDLGSRNLAQCMALKVQEAVHAAVSTGLIDPGRLHVMGHSMGGWAAMALLAETDLFRSGIAMAGISNLVSFHGTFDARFRYDDDGSATSMTAMCERVFSMPGPPCEMPDRYIALSPVFAAHRINAPLIIVQGDQDYVSIGQGEEMYSALRRLGKPVRFVRYWGEGHVIAGAANIADMWTEVMEWLDEADRAAAGVQ
ncbi:alpha/beta fold hydrolase [Cupriavidus gilardii]|uniref:alpha/beta fold hydrolase n=1 Tax=Cupriavidus gilardii TaxID=82541 RepID=UPI001C2EB231|nr:alpha/beta fold hydrolase [Cupriavidus gilardii]MCT9071237.1 alpha/beta fold hydrolase [Cupriavidus gilardii]MCT9115947.1 alpha/beta fold hydrolase [Cupriavidus gilardii]